jgi:cytidine deaminase
MDEFLKAHYQDLQPDEHKLVEEAKKATSLAYAPYSNFFVGAALLLQNGAIVLGANQENASYPLCMCAERVALYTKATQYAGNNIAKMAVVARKANYFVPVTCCGACRQVMAEFEQRQQQPFQVIMEIEPQKWVRSSSASGLLPFQFQF